MIFLMTETTTAKRKFTIQIDWIRATITPTDNAPYGDGDYIRNSRNMGKDWSKEAEALIDKYQMALGLEPGVRYETKSYCKGYKTHYEIGHGVFVGYHPMNRYMGLVVDFGGQALAKLREQGLMTDVHWVKAFRSLEADPEYKFSTTTLDVAIDDYNGSRTVLDFIKLYHEPVMHNWTRGVIGRMHVYKNQSKFRNQKLSTRTFTDDRGGATLYLGSKESEKTMRIYNKMAELGLEPTAEIQSIVRFEGTFRKESAWQLGNWITEVNTWDAVARLLYRVMFETWNLRGGNGRILPEVLEWWRLSGEAGHLVSMNRRRSDLRDTLIHVMDRSGLKSMVGKAHLIHGDIPHDELIAPLLKDMEKMLLGYLQGGLFSDDVRAYAKANPDEEIPWLPQAVKDCPTAP